MCIHACKRSACIFYQLVTEMSNRQTEYITCRSEQVVCVTHTGRVYWWGTGLRYREDVIAVDGVKKELLEGRLEFDNAKVEGDPEYMVSVEDKAAPLFKQRIADYYLKRGIYSDGNADGMVIVGHTKAHKRGACASVMIHVTCVC
jgi:hypothetical protein